MKKMKLFCGILIGLMIFSSCSSDDDSNSDNTSTSIIGKWKLTAENIGGQSQSLSDCEKEQTMEFYSDGTVENYYVDNDPCDFSTITFDYTKNSNQLIFSIDGEGINGGTYVLTSTIEVLNDTTLRYKFISDNEDGTYPVAEQNTQTYIRDHNIQERLDNGETPYEIYLSNNDLLNLIYGLNYQGGIIFHLDINDGTGMISSPNDLSTNAVWGCEGINISGAEFSSIGSGLTNTQEIVANCNDDIFAAKICASYSLNGNDEWYLPSKEELNLMYQNLKTNNIGNFSDAWYWTSTEFEDQDTFDTNGYEAAWIQSFNDGSQATYDVGIKHFENIVRAIRNY